MLQEVGGKQHQEQPLQQFQFSFTLASFEQTIKHNFQLVQKLINQHQLSIDDLKLQIQLQKMQEKPQVEKTGSKEVVVRQRSKRETQKVSREQSKTQKVNETKVVAEVKVSEQVQTSPHKVTTASEKIQTDPPSLPIQKDVKEGPEVSEEHSSQQQIQVDMYVKQSIEEDKKIKDLQFSVAQKDAFESKMFELFERVRQLEEKDIVGSRQIQKAFKQFEFTMQSNNKAIEKATKDQGHFEEEVQKLRNQLSEYKIKKETKLNKLLQSNSLNQSGLGGGIGGDSYDYVAEKIQFLLKHVKELLSKKSFEEERELLQVNIDVLRRKLTETINEKFFQQSLKNSEIKIYNTVVKYIKAVQSKRSKDGPEEESDTQLDKIISEGNKEFNEKVATHEQKLNTLFEQFQGMRSQMNLQRKDRLQIEEDVNEQLKSIQDHLNSLSSKIDGLERSSQDLRQNFTKQHLESQGQIIDLQEQVQKLNSHVKTYNYAFGQKNLSPIKSRDVGQNDASTPLQNSIQLSPEKNPNDRVVHNFIEQEISMIKKKVSKMNIKIQGVKEDLLTVRNDFTRQLDGMKMSIQKKADWDSLKKALSYFDQKQKETKIIIEHLYNSEYKNQQSGDESLAVKKGWTCLMCDRDIKNYEGKLSEAKFTSMFPIRQSPRIGGYYKQQQSSQQYKQLFMNNPLSNNRNKRVGSLRSNATNQSREQLHV